MFLALVTVELADIMFAVDSIPAVFAITTDPFLIYTSNIFAILGLRALFFVLSATMERFAYLKYALAALLMFIGGKVLGAELLGVEKIPAAISLGVTVAILTAGFVVSIWKTRGGKANKHAMRTIA
jgi:tellurite resistance protein TerC